MEIALKHHFVERWTAYFPSSELPIVFSYTDEETSALSPSSKERFHCIICELKAVRDGTCRRFELASIACGGARRYLGFDTRLRPTFPHFLSCGIPGEVKGERYKESPALDEAYLETQPSFEAPASKIAFKRWDRLEAEVLVPLHLEVDVVHVPLSQLSDLDHRRRFSHRW